MAGGHVASLFQPVELIMIGGSALGPFFVANSPKTIKATLKALPSLFKGSKFSKALYIDLCRCSTRSWPRCARRA